MTVAWKLTQAQSQDAAINAAKAVLDVYTANAAATLTLTTAQLINGLLANSVQASTITTPTAAAIVAAIKGCAVGTHFYFTIVCLDAFAATLAGGTGVTVPAAANVVTAACAMTFIGVVTNATVGAEAVYLSGQVVT